MKLYFYIDNLTAQYNPSHSRRRTSQRWDRGRARSDTNILINNQSFFAVLLLLLVEEVLLYLEFLIDERFIGLTDIACNQNLIQDKIGLQ